MSRAWPRSRHAPVNKRGTSSLRRAVIFLAAAFCLAVFGAGFFGLRAQQEGETQDETKFTMGRVYFDVPLWAPLGSGAGAWWSHDTPRGEEHLMKIMAEVTELDANPEPHVISFKTDDCFKYPVAYMCEVGYLSLTDEEAHRMSEYLLRGGFLIVDDFRSDLALQLFEQNLQKVFPGRKLEEVPRTDPIFTGFYDISNVFPVPPYSRFYIPRYLGMRDDKGRLMMIVDFNNDLSEYWEWSDNSLRPIDETNEAYKYGVNYLMYALTH
jgi:hypothetical protein